ncbi:TolC family protein [Nibricoccus aquaticus]|nr:TolC family protein [Nibricoccus aquaticus]
MSLLRPYILWLVAVQAVGRVLVVGAETPAVPVIAEAIDPLMAALPERSLRGLEELLRVGLENGPTILVRRWEAEQSVQNTRIARAPMLPNARASFRAGVTLEQRDDGGARSDRTLAAVLYDASVSQPVYHWGALSKNHDIAKLTQAVSSRNLEETRRLLALDLRRRYLELVTVDGAIEMARKNLKELNRQFDFAKKQVEDGFAASTASGLITGQITAAELVLQQMEDDRDMRRYDLARVSGVAVEKLPATVAELPKPAELDAVVKALSAAEGVTGQSARMLNAEDSVRMETLRYQVEKTRLKPKLGVSFSGGQDNRTPDNDVLGKKSLVTSWNAFATVDWQLFDGFSAKASQRASLARLRSYEADRDLVARVEADERRSDVNRLQLYWRQLQQAEIAFGGARGAVEAVEKDVAAGWIPASEADLTRLGADTALQAVNVARTNFYTALATYFSNRGLDPAVRMGAR